jgi:hypothetical protein
MAENIKGSPGGLAAPGAGSRRRQRRGVRAAVFSDPAKRQAFGYQAAIGALRVP